MYCSSIHFFFFLFSSISTHQISFQRNTRSLCYAFPATTTSITGNNHHRGIRERAARRGAVAWSVGDYGVVVSFRPMEEGKRRDGGGEVGDDGWWW
jgi:hypothetical protein